MRDIGPRLYHLENLDLCATDGRADAVELREHNLWARIHPFRLALASGVGDIGARRVHSYLGSITCASGMISCRTYSTIPLLNASLEWRMPEDAVRLEMHPV